MIMQRQPQLCSTWLLVRVVVEHIRRLSRARQTLPLAARDRLRFACTMWAWHGATRWQGTARRWRQVCLPPPRVAAPGLSRRFGLLRCTVCECVRELVVSELRVQSHQTNAENVSSTRVQAHCTWCLFPAAPFHFGSAPVGTEAGVGRPGDAGSTTGIRAVGRGGTVAECLCLPHARGSSAGRLG